MRYGFVIAQDRCIGCHACTVACKEEHQVPIGVFRTWVKIIEQGSFPHAQRAFGVMRCNHCDAAPCTAICPTSALFRRSNGIIDFDSSRCVGCKACMQACPYDALYLDPASNTAAKCNFCAHRVERGLEPACVIVCPTQAILAGDLDDPSSNVSRVIAEQTTTVLKPEKGTAPKLHYVALAEPLLHPERLQRPATFAWSERRGAAPNGARGKAAGAAREVYNVAHPAPWGGKIALYLWTKSLSAGALLVAALIGGAGLLHNVVAPAVALVFLAATLALLVADLKRPERFHFLLTKANPSSWLVRGAWVLSAYGVLALAWLLAGAMRGVVPPGLAWLTAFGAAAAAIYTAFLFDQAQGRDLWQSKLFFWHLLAQAFIAGAAVWLGAAILVGAPAPHRAAAILALALAASAALLMGEAWPHGGEAARLARRNLWRGALWRSFWRLALGFGCLAPLLLSIMALLRPPSFTPLAAAAAVLALAGIWWWDSLWIAAGQIIPLS
ncbi:MAG: 4Fe-4S dicluster domain-containing protein [Terriglobales bacterium]